MTSPNPQNPARIKRCKPSTPRATPSPCITLRDDLRDAEGLPRACIALPGQRLPRAFGSLADALAALRAMETK
ncbi:MAG: hypothetical protein ING16_13325 [Roseomonas sp.]|nr:hypothetical protein [Roseomonas sp.]